MAVASLEAAPRVRAMWAVDGLVALDSRRALLERVARLLPVLGLQTFVVPRPALPQLELAVLATERLERAKGCEVRLRRGVGTARRVLDSFYRLGVEALLEEAEDVHLGLRFVSRSVNRNPGVRVDQPQSVLDWRQWQLALAVHARKHGLRHYFARVLV